MSRKDVIDATTGEIVTDDIPLEKREKFMASVNRSPKSINNEKGKEYMSDPNVIKFTSTIADRAFKKRGRPYAFESVEQLENDTAEYLKLCYDTNTIPTVASASMYLDCDRDTLYNHANNPNSIFFGTCKNLINLCHFALENGAVNNKVNSVLYIFLSKNYFGMEDNKNITVTPVNNATINNSETMDALQKQIADENTPNADYQEM